MVEREMNRALWCNYAVQSHRTRPARPQIQRPPTPAGMVESGTLAHLLTYQL